MRWIEVYAMVIAEYSFRRIQETGVTPTFGILGEYCVAVECRPGTIRFEVGGPRPMAAVWSFKT